MTLSLARAFAGHVMVELIEQHDDGPSVYHEGDGLRRYGFHHFAMSTRTRDDDLARYEAVGCKVACCDRLPSGARVIYLDRHGELSRAAGADLQRDLARLARLGRA